ncbi:DoxX family protein [Mitsuaria sp. 7]|uniref:DoxX family protein n=1 Tax=Mitsuaria sp. 7 TaxID=1658665 RepID=UPI0007DCF295|nr:DoxX family protein [Mitsuaria sp. 7]ANH68871.1 DoxX family protein [Mitsuaria sp. 7]
MAPVSSQVSRRASPLRAAAARLEPAAYALLRVAFGAILFTHGLPKALGTSHGSMADPMAGSIRLIDQVMGLPFAPQLAVLVMLLETVGAVALAAGFCTRWVALAFTLEMIGICVALGPTWPWIDRGIEYPVLMAALAAYVVVRGGGAYAVDGRVPWAASASAASPS